MDSMFDAWNDPPLRHAILVHFPIALSALGLVVTPLAALRPANGTLRSLVVGLWLAVALLAWMTVASGENAEDHLGDLGSERAHELVHDHEEMAERFWMFPVAAAILALGGAVLPSETGRKIASWLAVVAALAAVGWVAATAHRGGTLVYHYGAGVRLARPDPATAGDPADPRLAFFRERVAPILAGRCVRCHNPAKVAKGKSAGLDQTSIAGLLRGGDSGPAIVPGDPEASLLIRKVTHPDPDERMPPEGDPLTPEQIDALARWIREGAVWDPAGLAAAEDAGRAALGRSDDDDSSSGRRRRRRGP